MSSSASESPKEPLADWLKWLGPENWKQIEASVAIKFSGSLPEGGVGDGRQSREETGKKIMRTSAKSSPSKSPGLYPSLSFCIL